MAIPNTTPWATPQDVATLTGATADANAITAAQSIIEMDSGARLIATDPSWASPRNLDWLRRAVAYQCAWMAAQPDFFTRMSVSQLSQDGVSATFGADSMTLAPLAKRCLGRLSWRGTRTVTPSINRTTDRAGYRTSDAPDLPDIASVPAYVSDDYDDALPWQGM